MSGHEVQTTHPAVDAATRIARIDEQESRSLAPLMERPPGWEASGLALWAWEAQQAARLAVSLAKTQFVPASMQGKPHDITAAILAGHELGMKPMATLRSIDVIHGTPALRAHAMRGLLQSKGHRLRVVEASPTRVVMEGQRWRGGPLGLLGGNGYELPQTVEWTIERAALLGLTGKPEWKKQPQTMLIARATGELARLIAADVLFAMPYAAEEIERDEVAEERAVTVAELTESPSERLARVRGEAKAKEPRKAQPGTVRYAEPFTEGPLVDVPLPFDDRELPEADQAVDTGPPSAEDDWPEVAVPPDKETSNG